jgi:hypothetical protein
MSLLTTASPWTNDQPNTNNITRKRISTMRKTIKKNPNTLQLGDDIEFQGDEQFTNTSGDVPFEKNILQPSTIESTKEINENRNSHINKMIEKMTTLDSDSGSKLGNFNPPPKPVLNNRKPDPYQRDSTSELGPTDLLPGNTAATMANVYNKSGTYSANSDSLGNYSNYKTSYDPPKIDTRPYYAKMGLATGGASGAPVSDKLMEKINYMIHLLEEQQGEKTNNVTEEFILYTFLGVFIIFIVDSFARAGKYVR